MDLLVRVTDLECLLRALTQRVEALEAKEPKKDKVKDKEN